MHDLGKDFLHNTDVTLTLQLENLVHGHCITFTQKHSAGEVWASLVKEIENLLQASDVEWTDSQLNHYKKPAEQDPIKKSNLLTSCAIPTYLNLEIIIAMHHQYWYVWKEN